LLLKLKYLFGKLLDHRNNHFEIVPELIFSSQF
jgi:hypothetical protein